MQACIKIEQNWIENKIHVQMYGVSEVFFSFSYFILYTVILLLKHYIDQKCCSLEISIYQESRHDLQ